MATDFMGRFLALTDAARKPLTAISPPRSRVSSSDGEAILTKSITARWQVAVLFSLMVGACVDNGGVPESDPPGDEASGGAEGAEGVSAEDGPAEGPGDEDGAGDETDEDDDAQEGGAVAGEPGDEGDEGDEGDMGDEGDEGGEGDDPGVSYVLGVNFQPQDGDPPTGWSRDSGAPFDAGRGYGWDGDLSAKTRRRGLDADPLLDTAIFPGEQGRSQRWELALPAASYRVSVASGDALAEQGPNRIVAEGVVLIDSAMSAPGQFLFAQDVEVTVADGRLTLDVGDGTDDTALNWIVVRTEGEEFPGDGPPDVVPPDDDPPDDDPPDDDPPDDPPPADCIASSLADGGAIDAAGFNRQAGTFRDGGWAVDNQCDRLRIRLPGDWSVGTLAFDAKGLLRAQPHDERSHGCERFILNMNRESRAGAAHARLYFASMTSGCAGSPRGNLRVGLSDGACCIDSGRMPDVDEGGWRRFELSWTPGHIRVTVDGDVWVDGGSGGSNVGSDVDLEFGSECVGGDQNLAVFRNLEICPG